MSTYLVGLVAVLLEALGDYAAVCVGAFGDDYFNAGRKALTLMRESGSEALASKTVSASLKYVLETGICFSSAFVGRAVADWMGVTPETNGCFIPGWCILQIPYVGGGGRAAHRGATQDATPCPCRFWGKLEMICFGVTLGMMWTLRVANDTLLVCACKELKEVPPAAWCAPEVLKDSMVKASGGALVAEKKK